MRERSMPPFNRDPVIVLSAGFALLSAQRPDRARSVLLQESLGACAVPPVPAVTVLYRVGQRFRELLSMVASALHLELLRERFRALVHRLVRRPDLQADTAETTERDPAEPGQASGCREGEPDLIRYLAEFEQEDQREATGSYWMPHAPTKGGRIMTGSA